MMALTMSLAPPMPGVDHSVPEWDTVLGLSRNGTAWSACPGTGHLDHSVPEWDRSNIRLGHWTTWQKPDTSPQMRQPRALIPGLSHLGVAFLSECAMSG